ncbi:MAG: Sigma-54 factor, core binding domain, partial [Methanoculleus sp.]|nr:Sigma-54 factor, core binding domain [Methanoculleus sp.]
MGLFDRLKGLKADYEARASKTLGERAARKEEEAVLRSAETHLVKGYNLKRTSQPGRYLVGNDKVVDVNIRSLDSNGYLTTPIADIKARTGWSGQLVQKAWGLVKQLDPPGVGAR